MEPALNRVETQDNTFFQAQSMARIIVYHYSPAARVPSLTPAQCAAIRQKYAAVCRAYPGANLRGVFADANGQGICEWEAPSVAVVNEIITQVDGHPPIDGAVLVKQII
jgi:hypothetical protein